MTLRQRAQSLSLAPPTDRGSQVTPLPLGEHPADRPGLAHGRRPNRLRSGSGSGSVSGEHSLAQPASALLRWRADAPAIHPVAEGRRLGDSFQPVRSAVTTNTSYLTTLLCVPISAVRAQKSQRRSSPWAIQRQTKDQNPHRFDGLGNPSGSATRGCQSLAFRFPMRIHPS
jgi:hypothetical protein